MSEANPVDAHPVRSRTGTLRRGRMILPVLMLLLLLGPSHAPLPTPDRESSDAAAGEQDPPLSAPVLIVPGWMDGGTDLEFLRERLIEAGWVEDRVATLQFEDPVGSNIEHAVEVQRAVAELRMSTGASRVDIVAHSMGGLAVRYFLLFLDGDELARSVIFLGTPHRGTLAAHLAWGEGGSEMVPGSEFLLSLNGEGTVPDGIRVQTVRTSIDLRILPMSSATLPGAPDVEVCCPSHAGLLYDEGTFEVIRDFLGGG